MFSQCPRCRTIFMVAPADLAAARGDTVCGHCGSLFNALRSLSEYPPEPDEKNLDEHEIDLPAPPLRLPISEPMRAAVASFDPDRDAVVDDEPSPMPVFAPTPRVRSSDWRWWSITALLVLVLILELGWAERSLLAKDERFRPTLDRICASVGCWLPLRRDASQLALTSREIRPHPSVPGALLISATIRNQADFAQPFPDVRIRLTDLNESPVASRRFVPADYLVDAGEATRGLAAEANAVLLFEVVDPGRNAVAFDFTFE
ncbi:MAG: zinc-ribbon and DUF3426 domain-containing protein [Dokdonella sp.]